MAALGKGKGFFKLNDSDHFVGSLFSVDDLYKILEIDKVDVEGFRNALLSLKILQNNDVIDEKFIYKYYKTLRQIYSSIPLPSSSSFDECVLKHIFVKALDGAKISQQIGFRDPKTNGTKHVDFKVEFNGQTKYVEFDGPEHFSKGNVDYLPNPIDRKHLVEDVFDCECILWPFWIQRCELNAKALFDKSIRGVGALWSTTCFFNSFNIPTPSKVIVEETRQFGAERRNGIGYIYGKNTEGRNMPEHPIINRIYNGKKSIEEIIPIDVTTNREYWVPEKLWHLL